MLQIDKSKAELLLSHKVLDATFKKILNVLTI